MNKKHLLFHKKHIIHINQLFNKTENELNTVKDWCKQNSSSYKLDSTWSDNKDLNEIQKFVTERRLKDIPKKFLYKFITGEKETKQMHFYYLNKLIIPGELKPFDMVKENIKLNIINERKSRSFDKYISNLLNNVNTNKDVQIY